MILVHQLLRNRIALGVGALLALALAAGLVAAALNARAGNHETTIIGAEAEMFAAGNEFTDDVRAEYRLKFGESDDVAPGESGDAPPHASDGRETFERLVNDGSNVHIGSLRFQAEDNGEIGGVDWHTHPGPFIVAVTQGELTVTWSTDCEPRTYEAGEAFMDLGEVVHKAENFADEETVVYFAVVGVPDGEPITNVVADDEGFEEPC